MYNPFMAAAAMRPPGMGMPMPPGQPEEEEDEDDKDDGSSSDEYWSSLGPDFSRWYPGNPPQNITSSQLRKNAEGKRRQLIFMEPSALDSGSLSTLSEVELEELHFILTGLGPKVAVRDSCCSSRGELKRVLKQTRDLKAKNGEADLSNIHQVAMNLGWGQLFQKGGAVPGAGAGNLQAPEYSAAIEAALQAREPSPRRNIPGQPQHQQTMSGCMQKLQARRAELEKRKKDLEEAGAGGSTSPPVVTELEARRRKLEEHSKRIQEEKDRLKKIEDEKQKEEERKLKEEEDRLAHEDAKLKQEEAKLKQIEEEKRQKEEERKLKEEEDRLAKEEAKLKQIEEEGRQKEEERKLKEEEDRLAKEEAKLKQIAEEKQKEEERKLKEEEERLAKEEAKLKDLKDKQKKLEAEAQSVQRLEQQLATDEARAKEEQDKIQADRAKKAEMEQNRLKMAEAERVRAEKAKAEKERKEDTLLWQQLHT
eukprot:symbB.v1.2.031579.t1/scaffold3682.1/size52094/2